MLTDLALAPTSADTRDEPVHPMRLLVTGGSGALGRALVPMARRAGHTVIAPARGDLDLFDPIAVARAVGAADAVLHLATRVRSLDKLDVQEAWRENDRLRAEASALLVAAAREAATTVYVQPSVTFVYPALGAVDEDTPIGPVSPILLSALVAEHNALRFTGAGRRGVVLRLGLLDGPGTGHSEPVAAFGATLHVADAARALLAALALPGGIYNVCRDAERISNARISQIAGWRPTS
jgi:nucleoside-diphosphate-sugar epimerase